MDAQDKSRTHVIFRKYRDGQIIALFPYEFWNDFLVCSYMHIGQHGGADYFETIRATKPAKEDEYKELRRELTSMGYFLKVDQKLNRKLANFSVQFN